MDINLNLLRTFQLVAEHQSFRQAAELTGRTQTAISLRIQSLEKQLGLRLFDRTTRRVELTPEGEILLVSVKRALAELDSCLSTLDDVAHLLRGHITLACIPTYAASRLPSAIAAFQRAHPEISLRILEYTAPNLLDSLVRKEVDFGICPEPGKSTRLVFTRMFDEEAYALFPANTKLPPGESIDLHRLASWPLLSLTKETLFRKEVDAAFATIGTPLEAAHEVSQVNTLVAMAEAGLGVALLPGLSVPEHTCCQVRSVTAPGISRSIGIVRLNDRQLSPAAARFIQLLMQHRE